jgi:hypothetical protein
VGLKVLGVVGAWEELGEIAIGRMGNREEARRFLIVEGFLSERDELLNRRDNYTRD